MALSVYSLITRPYPNCPVPSYMIIPMRIASALIRHYPSRHPAPGQHRIVARPRRTDRLFGSAFRAFVGIPRLFSRTLYPR